MCKYKSVHESREWECIRASILISCRGGTGQGCLCLYFVWMYVNLCEFYVHMRTAKCSAVPVAACVASPWVCTFCERVCVCGLYPTPCCWSNPQRETAVAASVGCRGRQLQLWNVQQVEMQWRGRRDPKLLGSAWCVGFLNILNSGGNTSASLKLHYISEVKNWKASHCNIMFSDASFFITYFCITPYVFLCVL